MGASLRSCRLADADDSAAGEGRRCARLTRERQDLVGEWRAKDKVLIAARSVHASRRNAQNENALAVRLAAIDNRFIEIDKALAIDFPDFAALASPKPLSIAEVQMLLRAVSAHLQFGKRCWARTIQTWVYRTIDWPKSISFGAIGVRPPCTGGRLMASSERSVTKFPFARLAPEP
jgi:hypothetical protein